MDYEQMQQQLTEWLSAFTRRVPSDEAFRVERTDVGGKVILATQANQYSISFHPETDYLGAVASTRTTRAGETWTRGSDLHDGRFSRETFDAIFQDILAYELVPLAPQDYIRGEGELTPLGARMAESLEGGS